MNTLHKPLLSPYAQAIFGSDSEPETVECSKCRTEYDAEDIGAGEVRMHKVNGEDVCHACVEVCDGSCGEYLDDSVPDHFGPHINLRRWEVDGRLGKFHAICAVDYLLQSWTEDGLRCADDYNRAQIRVIVAVAFEEVTR